MLFYSAEYFHLQLAGILVTHFSWKSNPQTITLKQMHVKN